MVKCSGAPMRSISSRRSSRIEPCCTTTRSGASTAYRSAPHARREVRENFTQEIPMRLTILIALAVLFLAGCATTPSGPLTAYEGARLIVGDGGVVENATLL